jgi:UDP-N-acetylglucosamine 2-epimerase (non-hydrolysing)
LRDTTERPETIEIGTTSWLVVAPRSLLLFFEKIINDKWKKGGIPEKWDGKAGDRIVNAINKILKIN